MIILIGFLLTILAYIVSFYYIVTRREKIVDYFMQNSKTRRRAMFKAAFLFSAIEEGILNLVSGTLFVLIATVPALVLFILIAIGFGKVFKAQRALYPLLFFMAIGLLFEMTVGGHSDNFTNPETPVGEVIFGIVLTLFTYAYCGLIALKIQFERKEKKE